MNPDGGDALAQQIAFANQRQVALAINKAMLGGADHQITAVTRCLFKTQNMLWRDLDVASISPKCFAASSPATGENHRPAKGFEESTQIIQRRFVLRLDRQLGSF